LKKQQSIEYPAINLALEDLLKTIWDKSFYAIPFAAYLASFYSTNLKENQRRLKLLSLPL
jgi:hypothetical protein